MIERQKVRQTNQQTDKQIQLSIRQKDMKKKWKQTYSRENRHRKKNTVRVFSKFEVPTSDEREGLKRKSKSEEIPCKTLMTYFQVN